MRKIFFCDGIENIVMGTTFFRCPSNAHYIVGRRDDDATPTINPRDK